MLQDALPTEIAGKVFRGNPIESLHPLLESAVLGVDVLDMKQGLFFVDELVRQEFLRRDSKNPGKPWHVRVSGEETVVPLWRGPASRVILWMEFRKLAGSVAT